jgi:hypothetical protein
MYVPHYDAILHAIGTSRAKLEGKTEIEIPVSLFKFLLQHALVNGEFNAAGYLAANKDIQEAVDENWYRRTYSDIANAVRKGEISSGSEHFDTVGAEEFRAPATAYLADAVEWKKAAGKV